MRERTQRVPDAIDRSILTQLQADGRMSFADLADKVGLSPSPCLRRIRLLERAGIIARYVAVLDQEKCGLPVSVFVSIKLDSQRVEALNRFGKAIARWPEVLECYLMTGPRDYLLRVVVADPRRLRALPQGEADAAGRHRVDRIELRARTGEIHQRAADCVASPGRGWDACFQIPDGGSAGSRSALRLTTSGKRISPKDREGQEATFKPTQRAGWKRRQVSNYTTCSSPYRHASTSR